ncbi:MAG: hypothetical protein LH645_11270 [Actinomycetia bacterium]|nr:hypothetical protein [Actinomycetes bacterium]
MIAHDSGGRIDGLLYVKADARSDDHLGHLRIRGGSFAVLGHDGFAVTA